MERDHAFWTDLRGRLDSGAPIEWVVTGIFYEAVHLVEAALATKGIDSGTHYRQGRHVEDDPRLRPIFPDLKLLNDRSNDARYRCIRPSEQAIDESLVPALENIRRAVTVILDENDRDRAESK